METATQGDPNQPTRLRPIRFGNFAGGPAGDRTALLEAARKAEQSGFSTFGMGDHFFIPMAPLIALQAVAEATTTLRLTMGVLCSDFRHPAVLAKELATLDVLSGGRLEIGLGAGYLEKDYVETGITYDKPSVRIERLEEVVLILKGLFADSPFTFSGKHFSVQELHGLPKPLQRPQPPILVGGGGPKILSVAARHADIIGIVPGMRAGKVLLNRSGLSPEAFHERVALIRDVAGQRLDKIELNTWVFGFLVTEDQRKGVRAAIDALGGASDMTEEQVLSSPAFAIGTVQQICEKLLETRERYGINYFSVAPGVSPESIVPVLAELGGE